MKKLLYSALALALITSCKKEITDQQKINSLNQSEATVANDTAYFNGGAFTGGSALIFADRWGDAYGDIFHLPDGCKLSYIRFKINRQDGAIINALRVDAAGTTNVRRHLARKQPGEVVAFTYATPALLTIEDQSDPTKHIIHTYIKVSGAYNSWTRIMPDSISILGADNKPLPVKGFLHSDWPAGTPLVWKNIITD